MLVVFVNTLHDSKRSLLEETMDSCGCREAYHRLEGDFTVGTMEPDRKIRE